MSKGKKMSCCNKSRTFARTKGDNDVTRIIAISAFSAFIAAFNIYYPTVFIPDMIIWLGFKEYHKGFYSGMILTAYYVGKTLFSPIWGRLSDRIGRTRVLYIILWLSAISCLAFSFSVSIHMAVAIRFIDGGVSCVGAIIRAILHDFTTEKNQKTAMSTMQMVFFVGLSIGPLVGGFLSSPVQKYPTVFGKNMFLTRFPFFIPSLIGFILPILNSVVVFLAFPKFNQQTELEGHCTAAPDAHETEPIALSVTNTVGTITEEHLNESNHIKALETKNETKADSSNCNNHIGELPEKCCCLPNPWFRLTYIIQLMKYKGVIHVIVVYCLFSFGTVGNIALLAAWMSMDRDLGGLAFSSNFISIYACGSCILGIVPAIIYNIKFGKKFTAIKQFIITALCVVICQVMLPLSRLVEISPWITLLPIGMVIMITYTISSATIFVLINNSVPQSLTGSVVGLGEGACSFIKSAAPLGVGSLLMWTATFNYGPPIDATFPFVAGSFITWLACVIAVFLPTTLNSPFDKTS